MTKVVVPRTLRRRDPEWFVDKQGIVDGLHAVAMPDRAAANLNIRLVEGVKHLGFVRHVLDGGVSLSYGKYNRYKHVISLYLDSVMAENPAELDKLDKLYGNWPDTDANQLSRVLNYTLAEQIAVAAEYAQRTPEANLQIEQERLRDKSLALSGWGGVAGATGGAFYMDVLTRGSATVGAMVGAGVLAATGAVLPIIEGYREGIFDNNDQTVHQKAQKLARSEWMGQAFSGLIQLDLIKTTA